MKAALAILLLLTGCASQVTIAPSVNPVDVIDTGCRSKLANAGGVDEFIVRRGELEITDRRVFADQWRDDCGNEERRPRVVKR